MKNENPQYVQIVSFRNKTYDATATRKGGVLGIVDALVHQEGEESFTGELLLPKDHPPVEKHKFYLPALVLGKTFEGKLQGRVHMLTPYSPPSGRKA